MRIDHSNKENHDDEERVESPDFRVKQEVDSWRPYAEALREEDRTIFREMMNSVLSSYKEAIRSAERGYDTESLLISILLDQQKTINWLSRIVNRMKKEERRSSLP